jgi:hypothetical protein
LAQTHGGVVGGSVQPVPAAGIYPIYSAAEVVLNTRFVVIFLGEVVGCRFNTTKPSGSDVPNLNKVGLVEKISWGLVEEIGS